MTLLSRDGLNEILFLVGFTVVAIMLLGIT